MQPRSHYLLFTIVGFEEVHTNLREIGETGSSHQHVDFGSNLRSNLDGDHKRAYGPVFG